MRGVGQIIFVTGTDTGVGKTVVMCLLVRELRRSGIHALGLKPFCTGSRMDARMLWRAGEREGTLEETNPFYFAKPVAPALAAVEEGWNVELKQVVEHIEGMAERCEVLLVEGVGGLLAPLGGSAGASPYRDCYTLLQLVKRTGGDVVVVGRNGLGTINHTCLTVRALPKNRRVAVVLMDQRLPDVSAETNVLVLKELLRPVPVCGMLYLGPWPTGRKVEKISKKALAPVLSSAIFSSFFGKKKGG